MGDVAPGLFTSLPLLLPVSSPILESSLDDGSGSGSTLALDHSWLVLASKKPEHLVRVCLCSKYLFSFPPAAIVISTSPEWLKTGNSFWGT
jgi:hypothetical protein